MSYRISKDTSTPMNAVHFSNEDELDISNEKTSYLQDAISMLTNSPSDWYMVLNERIALIDWDNKARKWAQLLGHLLTFLFYAIRLLQDNLIKPNNYKFTSKKDAFDLSKSDKLKEYEFLSRYATSLEDRPRSAETLYLDLLSGLSKVLDSSIILLIFFNLCLTYRFFWGCFRTYYLFNVKERPPSENVTKHSLSGLNDGYLENIYNGSLWSMLKVFFSKNINEEEPGDEGFYYTLAKWAPSNFITNIFISFCPSCLIFLMLTDVSFRTALVVVIHQLVLCFTVLHRFQSRIKDDSIINKATMAEFEEKVVKPLTCKKFQDVQVDATPYGNGFVRFLPATSCSRSHIFKSHTLNGDAVTERFNTRTQEFEDMAEICAPHNILIKPPRLRSYHSPGECQRCHVRKDAGIVCCNQSNGASPTRRTTPPGFYSPCVSSTSDMSYSQCRDERSSHRMNSQRSPCQSQNCFSSNYSRKKSRSPLRQSVLLSKHIKNSEPSDESHQCMSSRSSSKSPRHGSS